MKNLKVGDVIFVDSKGNYSENKNDVEVVLTRKQYSQHDVIFKKNSFCWVGETKNGKEWFSGYFKEGF